MENDKEVIIKYSSYTEAQKKATQKYRANNKEKVNEQRKKYYQERKNKDENFLEYKRTKAREYYNKKKEKAVALEGIDFIDEPVNNEGIHFIDEPVTEHKVEFAPIETLEGIDFIDAVQIPAVDNTMLLVEEVRNPMQVEEEVKPTKAKRTRKPKKVDA